MIVDVDNDYSFPRDLARLYLLFLRVFLMSRTLRFSGVAILLVALVATYLLRWDERAWLWLEESTAPTEQHSTSLWLSGYEAAIQIEVPGFEEEEFSDLAFNPVTRTLFTVSGKKPLLIELSLEGKVLRSIPVIGAANLEGVTAMDDGYMAITDERQHNLSIFRVDASTKELHTEQFVQQVDLGHTEEPNKGFEGLVWDKRNQRFLLGKEKYPVMIYSLPSDGRKVTGELQELASMERYMTDLSALTLDPRSGNIVVLSQESHLLLELDEQHQASEFIALLRGLNGLDQTIPQAEGVALDDVGNLYMVSEHNLFYVFHKESAQ